MGPRTEKELEALLEYLKRNRGFDFTGYKRPSLARRIEKRMGAVGVSRFAEYTDYLEVHPEEFAALFNTILINVTSFFRDEASWQYLAEEVLPRLIDSRPSSAGLRVWSAGCASGEEAYTLAMVLANVLGVDAFKERVKIYATDVDEDALARARQGVYTEQQVSDVPESFRKKYFDVVDGNYVFRKDMRRQVIFGRHDLITDAPISRVDLLVCRNTLMYLNAETQAKILARFHFGLNDNGILFLGRAETLLTHANTFTPIDLKRRISSKVARGNLDLRDRLLLMAQNGADDSAALTQHTRLREIAADVAPVSQLVVDAAGILVLANDRSRALFGIAPADLGRPLQDLKISYRPVELRSLIDQARTDRRPVIVRDIEWQPAPGDARWLELQVVPLQDAGAYVGASLGFLDVSSTRRLQTELEAAQSELQAAYEELQSTNEELETTNEELQSTVEELETTNEELQSTNEELETMNEELQATNEELHTINDELRQRSDDLNQSNAFLNSVVASIRGGVVVVDAEMRVLLWNPGAEGLFGLRDDEVRGKHFLGLDIGLPVNDLKNPIRSSLSGTSDNVSLTLAAVNRRGRPMRCGITITPLRWFDGTKRGAILVMRDAAELDPPAP